MERGVIIENFDGLNLKIIAEGNIIRDKIPDYDFFAKHQIKYPCIMMNGKPVWGFQGMLLSLVEYETIKNKSFNVSYVNPSYKIEFFEPAIFYGYITKDGKKYIREFNESSYKRLTEMFYIKKITEPFKANNLKKAKMKLKSILK